MKFLALSLALAAFSAQAQTTYPLGAGACLVTDGGRSVSCTVPDGTQFDAFSYNILTGAVVFQRSGMTYTGPMLWSAATIDTPTHKEFPFSVTMFPSSVLTGTKVMTITRSGRGTQTRTFYDFDSLTVF